MSESAFKNTHLVTYKAVRNNWADPETKTLEIRVTANNFRFFGVDAPRVFAVERVAHLNPRYNTEAANAAIIKIEEI